MNQVGDDDDDKHSLVKELMQIVAAQSNIVAAQSKTIDTVTKTLMSLLSGQQSPVTPPPTVNPPLLPNHHSTIPPHLPPMPIR
jgi:hypothetical protein